jgi:hypothetical protein
MTNYEPLREMDKFTEDMFNRIIAFQEHEHPAWNTQLPFAERIKGLPLHYLIFSNPDRDPQRFGPTVAAFYPLREELQKIAAYVRQLGAQPLVADVYAGNGFLGSLLAREGVRVTGLTPPELKPNQIEQFYDADCYRYTDTPLEALAFDAALVSWPPSGHNPTPALLARQPKLLVYIFTEHRDESSGRRQTGSDDMFDALADDYALLDEWAVTRPKDLMHEIWPDMTPSIEETRTVRIYARRDLQLQPVGKLPPATPYDWEQELHMALLALQAKQELQARGFPA